jgi:hypothetical protein
MIRRFLPLGILAISTLLLAILVQDFVRQVIVTPVLYAGWFSWLILTNLPQWTFWTLLTLVALLLAVRSLGGRKSTEKERPDPPITAQGPVTSWTHRLKQASTQGSSRWRVSRDLGRFYWETHFPTEPYHVQHYIARLSSPNSRLPADIRDYFLAGTERPPSASSFLFFRRTPQVSPALELDPEAVIEFLEKQLSPENEQAELSGSEV